MRVTVSRACVGGGDYPFEIEVGQSGCQMTRVGMLDVLRSVEHVLDLESRDAMHERLCVDRNERLDRLERRIRSLKGALTKAKKRAGAR